MDEIGGKVNFVFSDMELITFKICSGTCRKYSVEPDSGAIYQLNWMEFSNNRIIDTCPSAKEAFSELTINNCLLLNRLKIVLVLLYH